MCTVSTMADLTKPNQLPKDLGGHPSVTDSVAKRKGVNEETLFYGSGSIDELEPHLHARTFLAVFAVCLIYFAQDFALVGAGAVSFTLFRTMNFFPVFDRSMIYLNHLAKSNNCEPLPACRRHCLGYCSNRYSNSSSRPNSLTGVRLLGTKMVSGNFDNAWCCWRNYRFSCFEHGNGHCRLHRDGPIFWSSAIAPHRGV